jgi:hypothetical protein
MMGALGSEYRVGILAKDFASQSGRLPHIVFILSSKSWNEPFDGEFFLYSS